MFYNNTENLSVFQKLANTCINFIENSSGKIYQIGKW